MSVDNVEPFTWEELSGYLSKPFELFEKVMIFLATHPTPVGVVNNVSAVFSYGQNLPVFGEGIILKLRREIGEIIADLTSTR